MSLRPIRQVESLNIDFPTIHTSERGGILTYGIVSGIQIVQYANDPSGAIPAGLQYNDVEYMDLSRHYDPRRLREVEVSLGICGVASQGDYETDWITAVGNINAGDDAYVGPSGMLTNSASFGGHKVGYFLGTLDRQPHLVTFYGLGFARERMDHITKQIIFDNDSRARIHVLSDGFIKVRIKQLSMIKSQAGIR